MVAEATVEEPLNIRLQAKKNVHHGVLKLKPRQYQTELCNKALKENVIIYLGTGLGKTFVIVLFLNEPQVAAQIHDGRKVVFLAPTQDLIKQQAEYINEQTPYRVKIFCGRSARCGNHIDHWDRDIWLSEINQIDLLFMTPQIFAAAISTNIIDWSQFGTIIFDEVHHACRTKQQASKHPYGQILSHYGTYFRDRCNPPRMIGLTASLINRMPKDRNSITSEVQYLERILVATCITDVDVQDRRPQMVVSSYYLSEITKADDTLTSILEGLKCSIDATLKTNESTKLMTRNSRQLTRAEMKVLAFTNRLKLATVGLSIKPGSFAKVIDGLIAVRRRLGLRALKAICLRLVDALDKPHLQAFLSSDLLAVYKEFIAILRLIYVAVETFLGDEIHNQLMAYTRPKVKALLKILKEEYDAIQDGTSDKSTFSCIIFVRSRLEVVALTLLIQRISKLTEYDFIKCDFAVGLAAAHNSKYACITKRSAMEQHIMLKQFRNGDKNVIITTSVLEEGIDLPVCSTVIRYDKVRNFREYVQSRGRARQERSSFISMCGIEEVLDIEKSLDTLSDFEMALKELLKDNNIRTAVHPPPIQRISVLMSEEDEEDFFLCKEAAIRISSSTARTIINMYCNQLSKNTPFLEGVTYTVDQPTPQTFRAKVYLPSGCPMADGIVGRVKSDAHLAQNSAIVAAVKALYELKELDENGIPMRSKDKNVDQLLASIGFATTYEPLDDKLEGIKLINDGKEINYFSPKSSHPYNCLSRNYASRVYKLIKIRYVAEQQARVRAETRGYFEKCLYGLIVDSKTSNDFIPKVLHSHYGIFQVEYQLIDNFRIEKREEHNEFLQYTLKLLTKCLSLGPIRTQDFQQKCIFYIVPLNERNQPDIHKMRESFQSPPTRCVFRNNDIVRLNMYYRNNNNRDINNNRLMMIRRVRYDLNANCIIPGRRRESFLEAAENSYGRGVVRDINQPIIEVMPLSSEFASIRAGKKIVDNHSTESLFYLDQFLERFDQDPASVLQAFNKPEIIHQLYMMNAVLELDSKFLNETRGMRNNNVVSDLLLEEHGKDEVSNEGEDNAEIGVENEQPVGFQEIDSGDSDDVEGGEEEGEEFDEEVEDDETDSCSSDSSDGRIDETDYKSLLGRKKLDLNDHGDDEFKEKSWNLSQYYKAQNVPKIEYERRQYFDTDKNIADDPNYYRSIMELNPKIEPLKEGLLKKLSDIELRMTSDATFLNEEDELKKRTAKVDKSIAPSIEFDTLTKPLREGTRTRALKEALTLRRAVSDLNLEVLENIGDTYLKYLVSVALFKCTDGNEGLLTLARTQLTCNKRFTYLAKKRELGRFAITRPFSKDEFAYMLGRPIRQNGDPKQFYNLMRPKNLADIFESIVGSYLLYRGEYEALMVIEWLGLGVISKEPSLFDTIHERSVVFSKPPPALLILNDESREYFECSRKKLKLFEDIIGYKFHDPSYLIQAFTHATSTKKCTRSYERLEFLGDAVLDYLVNMHLSTTNIANSPGQLTSSKSAIVNNCAFAKLAMKYKFDLFIQHNSQELYDELVKVRQAMEDDPDMSFVDMINFDKIVKVLGDLFEAVAGALYLDSGMSPGTVWDHYYPMMKNSIEREVGQPTKNSTQILYEMFPGHNRVTFETFDKKTADGDLVAVVCRVAGMPQAFEGSGITKRQAKLRAIQEALKNPPSQELIARLNKDFLDSERVAGRVKPQRPTRGRGRGRRPGGHRESFRGSSTGFRYHNSYRN